MRLPFLVMATAACASTGVPGASRTDLARAPDAATRTSFDTTWYVSARGRHDGRSVRVLADSLEYGFFVTRFREPAGTPPGSRYLERFDAVRVDSARLAAADFLARIRAADSAAAGRGEGTVVYVHGFAVSFGRALTQGAEIAHRGSFRGPMIVFAWPAHTAMATWPVPGAILTRAYRQDSASAAASNDAFRVALDEVRAAVRPAALTVVGHSLGAQLVSESLVEPSDLREALEAGPLGALVLFAPDIAAARFRDTLAVALEPVANRRVVYASGRDWILGISQIVNHGPRVGRAAAARALAAEDVEVVDATKGLRADGGLRKIFEPRHAMRWSSSALYDFFAVVRGLPAACRTLGGVAERESDGTWQLTNAPIPSGIPPAAESCADGDAPAPADGPAAAPPAHRRP